MGIVSLRSTVITNLMAQPRVLNNAGMTGGVVRRHQSIIAMGAADSSTSKYRMFRIKSADYMDALELTTADIGTTVTVDVGLWDIETHANGGTVVDQDFFASAVNVHGGAIQSRIEWEAAAAGGLYTNAEKRIWEMLGLSSDPQKEYDVVITLTADTDAAGTLLLRAYVVS